MNKQVIMLMCVILFGIGCFAAYTCVNIQNSGANKSEKNIELNPEDIQGINIYANKDADEVSKQTPETYNVKKVDEENSVDMNIERKSEIEDDIYETNFRNLSNRFQKNCLKEMNSKKNVDLLVTFNNPTNRINNMRIVYKHYKSPSIIYFNVNPENVNEYEYFILSCNEGTYTPDGFYEGFYDCFYSASDFSFNYFLPGKDCYGDLKKIDETTYEFYNLTYVFNEKLTKVKSVKNSKYGVTIDVLKFIEFTVPDYSNTPVDENINNLTDSKYFKLIS